MTVTETTDSEGSRHWVVALAVSLAAFGVYLTSLAPSVLDADSGEFQFVVWLPGIAHPTGYPLYVLLGWVWTHLFAVGEVAWRLNLLSAIFAAGAAGLVFDVTARLLGQCLPQTPSSARKVAAAAAAATFAVSPTFWSQAIIAEVYALHALFVAIILGLALRLSAEVRWKSWQITLLIFICGLSLTHHLTTVLMFPGLALYLFLGRNRKPNQGPFQQEIRLRYIVIGGVPLLLYLYIPLIAPYTPYATVSLSQDQLLILYAQSPTGFLQHVTGAVFQGDLQPAAAGADRFDLTWRLLLQQFGWIGVGLALAGVIALSRRIDLLILTGATALAFVAFNLIYFIGDVFVLFIPVWLLVSLWIGIGALSIVHRLADYFVKSKANSKEVPAFGAMAQRLEQRIYRLMVTSGVGLLFLLPLSLWLANRQPVSQADNTVARDRWDALLAEPIPSDAVLITNDRNEVMSLWYYQYVEQRRPDLQALFPLIVPAPEYATVGAVLDQALASGRPVYLIKPMDGLNLKADLVAEGSLFRVTASDSPPRVPLDVLLPQVAVEPPDEGSPTETIKLIGYDLEPSRPQPGDTISVTLHWQPTQPLSIDYTSYVHLIDVQNQGVTQSDHQPGDVYYPTSMWREGEHLRDRHQLMLPATLTPGQYQLRVGMYYQRQSGTIAGMGDGVIIGDVFVSP